MIMRENTTTKFTALKIQQRHKTYSKVKRLSLGRSLHAVEILNQTAVLRFGLRLLFLLLVHHFRGFLLLARTTTLLLKNDANERDEPWAPARPEFVEEDEEEATPRLAAESPSPSRPLCKAASPCPCCSPLANPGRFRCPNPSSSFRAFSRED